MLEEGPQFLGRQKALASMPGGKIPRPGVGKALLRQREAPENRQGGGTDSAPGYVLSI